MDRWHEARRARPAPVATGPTIDRSPEPLRADAAAWSTVTPCRYCGMAATTVDHVFPQSLEGSCLDASACSPMADGIFHAGKTVPACRECNCLLGGRVFRSFTDRKACLKALLRRRYAKALAAPYWSDAEMGRLGYALRSRVVALQSARDLALQRLRW